jgi:DNA repair protein RAD7
LLQSNNISAAQIRDDYGRRVAEVARQAAEEEEDADLDMEEPEYEPTPEPDSPEDKAKKQGIRPPQSSTDWGT